MRFYTANLARYGLPLLGARPLSSLTRAEIQPLSREEAAHLKTSQSYFARIEGGKVRPSADALKRFAQATRTRLRIIFEPEAPR